MAIKWTLHICLLNLGDPVQQLHGTIEEVQSVISDPLFRT